MKDAQIDADINYQRAIQILERIDTPEYLINGWRMMGRYYGRVPRPEKVYPWYRGLERFIL